jgi:hypothetical protein
MPNQPVAPVTGANQGIGLQNILSQNAAISNMSKKPGQSVEEYSKTTRPSVVSLDEMREVWNTNVFGVLAKRFRGDVETGSAN